MLIVGAETYSRKAVRRLMLQLVEVLHVPKIARREALGVRNYLLKIPAQRLEESRTPQTFGMQISNVLSLPSITGP